MIYINQILVDILVLLGLIISWEDYKTNKIKNFWIILGLILGFLVYGLGIISNLQFPISNILLNVFLSIVVSYILWKTNIWAAGDAKLFIMFSFLLPLNFYSASYLPFFPSFALLLNIFIVVFVYLIFRSIIYHLRNFQFNLNKSFLGIKRVINSLSENYNLFLGFLVIILFFSFLYREIGDYIIFNLFTIQTLIFASLIIVSNYLGKFFQNKITKIIIPILFMLFIIYGFITDFYFTINIVMQAFSMMIIFMFAFMFFQILVDLYIERNEAKKIDINNLKEGMVMDRKIVEKLNLLDSISLHPKGLSLEQIKIIKNQAEKLDIDIVTVYKPFPFAIWMFLGIFATILVHGSIINYIINIFIH